MDEIIEMIGGILAGTLETATEAAGATVETISEITVKGISGIIEVIPDVLTGETVGGAETVIANPVVTVMTEDHGTTGLEMIDSGIEVICQNVEILTNGRKEEGLRDQTDVIGMTAGMADRVVALRENEISD
ncbi:MAG: hypothetical protein ACRC2T_00340 [Thermoguttaceae bacterium]